MPAFHRPVSYIRRPHIRCVIQRHVSDAAGNLHAVYAVQVPGFVQSLIMMPALRKWQNSTIRLIEELKAGTRIPPQPTGCFSC